MSHPHVSPGGRVRNPRQSPRWAREAAKLVGYAPMTCEKRVQLGIHEEVAQYILAARAWGDPVVSAKLEQPIRAALAGGPVLPVDEAIRKAQRADSAEEMAESLFLIDRTPENRKAFLDALREQVATSVQLIRSLEAEGWP